MARLPDPGADGGSWGELLNEYLSVAHGEEGRLKSLAGALVAAADATEASRGAAAYVCDGVADEVEIQAALDALPETGGRVLLSEGTFEISSTIRIDRDSVALVGVAVGEREGAVSEGLGTRLAAADGIENEIVLIQHRGNARPAVGVVLRDLSLDGRGYGTEIDGVHVRSHEGGLYNVRLHNTSGSGIRVHGYPDWDTYDTQLIGCHVRFAGAHSILLDDDSPDLHLLGCVLALPTLDNLHVRSGSQQITSCHLYGAGRNNVLFDNAGSRTKIIGCKIENAEEHGVLIDAGNGGWPGDLQLIGNGLKSNGRGADDSFDQILIRGNGPSGAIRTTLVGNSITWIETDGRDHRPRYGVHLEGAAARSSLVVANSFGPSSHFASAAVRDNSDPSDPATIHHNVNWKTEAHGTARIDSGSTSVLVPHGLAGAPPLAGLQATPTGSLGDATEFWVSSPDATGFRLHVDRAPGGAGVSFAWQAQSG